MEKNALSQLFSTQEQSELKQSFKEIICEHLKNDLEQMDCYLFDPSLLESMVEDIIDEVKEEMKDMLRTKLASFIDGCDIEKLMKMKKSLK